MPDVWTTLAPDGAMILGFAHHWLVKDTMVFEEEFHPNLRLSLEEKVELLGATGMRARCVWMYRLDTKTLIGETYGMSVKDAAFVKGEEGYDDLKPYLRPRSPKAIYCYSTTVLSPYQRLGLSKILKAYFLGTLLAQYDVVVGHAGASRRLNELFGAQFGRVYLNWYGTGQAHVFYQMNLDGGAR